MLQDAQLIFYVRIYISSLMISCDKFEVKSLFIVASEPERHTGISLCGFHP